MIYSLLSTHFKPNENELAHKAAERNGITSPFLNRTKRPSRIQYLETSGVRPSTLRFAKDIISGIKWNNLNNTIEELYDNDDNYLAFAGESAIERRSLFQSSISNMPRIHPDDLFALIEREGISGSFCRVGVTEHSTPP